MCYNSSVIFLYSQKGKVVARLGLFLANSAFADRALSKNHYWFTNFARQVDVLLAKLRGRT